MVLETLGINFSAYAASAIYWGGWVLTGIIIISVMVGIYYYFSFPVKAIVITLNGNGAGGYTVGKIGRNRVKWIKKRSMWEWMYPLFSFRKGPPFDAIYVYPGNKIIAYKIENVHIPGEINTSDMENLQVNPIPHHLKNWVGMEYKQIAEETAKQDFWNQNRSLLVGAGVVLFCLILCGVTIYWTYKFAGGGTEAINSLTSTLKGFGNVPAAP